MRNLSVLFAIIIFPLGLQAHTIHYLEATPLKIIKIGHPTLRKVADEVPYTDIDSPKMQKFFDDLIETMKKARGVGLAAPQVNVSKRIFVMGSGRSVPLTVVINPKVKFLEEHGQKNSTEGCLSIPGRRIRVKRYNRVHIDYINRRGDYVSEEAAGFKAIIIQHEYDHLNGILTVDRAGAELVFPEDYVSVPLM